MDASNPQVQIVNLEFARRGVALALFIAAATLAFGYGQTLFALAAAIAAILVYWLLPRPKVPEGAIHHDRMPAVIMPDVLGFMLATVFFALPLIVSAQEPWLDGPWGLYLMTGLPGLVVLYIFWISTRHQCMWLKFTGHDLTVADMHNLITLPYAEIAEVVGETKPPPAWLRPLLVLVGGWRGLGIALLQRDSHSLVFKMKDGTRRRIPSDALSEEKKLLAALQRGGVKLGSSLSAYVGKRTRRRPSTARRHAKTGTRGTEH